jgi:hypothetical protein
MVNVQAIHVDKRMPPPPLRACLQKLTWTCQSALSVGSV